MNRSAETRTSSNTPPDDTHVFVMTSDDTSALSELQAIAGEAFALLDTGHQIPHSPRAFLHSISRTLTA